MNARTDPGIPFAAEHDPVLQISEQDWLQARQTLAAQVPQLEVWAFSSRANGHGKPSSDLDLALMAEQPLTLAQLADMTHAFESSDLTIRVDVMEWANSNEAFRQIASNNKVVVQQSPASYQLLYKK